MSENPLGRLVPPDFVHVEKYPFADILAAAAPAAVERTLPLPRYRAVYDQGSYQACVGYSLSWMMSILNRRCYDAMWLWRRAKEIDGWPGNDGPSDNQGTFLRAGLDVLREEGHRRLFDGRSLAVDAGHGIKANRWASGVDEIRTAIAEGTPVVLGISWHTGFSAPERSSGRYWIARGPRSSWGPARGGHAICVYGASDRYQALWLVNTWGGYPLVLMPYDAVETLLADNGEAALVTDR